MLLALLYQLVRYLTDLVLVSTQSDAQLRAEVLALRHQLRVLERKVGKPAWQPGDRLLLAALSRLLRRSSLDALLPRPETLLRWHRELVRRKWAASAGRPPRPGSARHRERRELVLRLAQENPSWGYRRIQGEALKLGFKISHMGVAKILRRQRIPPGPRRRPVPAALAIALGASSSASTQPRCWPATSSPSRPSGSSASTPSAL